MIDHTRYAESGFDSHSYEASVRLCVSRWTENDLLTVVSEFVIPPEEGADNGTTGLRFKVGESLTYAGAKIGDDCILYRYFRCGGSETVYKFSHAFIVNRLDRSAVEARIQSKLDDGFEQFKRHSNKPESAL